jgi:hypothetical protein
VKLNPARFSKPCRFNVILNIPTRLKKTLQEVPNLKNSIGFVVK